MSEELKWIEDKAITIYENMLPKQVKGKLVYPKAYLEDDVKALIKKVKADARRDERERIKKKLLILFFGVEEWDCNSIRVNRKEIYEQDWIDFWKELKS